MLNRISLSAALLCATLSIGANSASALILAPEACMVTSVSGSTACEGIYEGNDSNQSLAGVFGVGSWTEVLKHNSGSAGSTSGNGVELTIGFPPGSAATWAIDTYNNNSPVMFVLKGGNTFSAFLMDTTVFSGTFDMLSSLTGGANTPTRNRKRDAGLSHWTVYSGGTVPSVPLPATLPLLLSALGFGGFALRKARKTA